MKSIVDVKIGKIEEWPEFIIIPIWLQASEDDSDDTEVPELGSASMRLAVSFENLQGTQAEAGARIKDFINTNYRTSITGSGYERLIDSLDKFLAKNDVSVYGKKFIPTPTSPTRH